MMLLKAAADVLKNCHTSKAEFANDFSPAEQIRQNLKVIDNEGRLKVYKEFENVRSKFIEIVGAFEKENIIKVPCHNDTLAGNFLGDENKLTLIDWEYSGRNDLYYDLATFSMENELNNEQEQQFLKFYFSGNPAEINYKRFYMNKFLTSFYWCVWSLIQIVYGKDADFYYPYGNVRLNAAKSEWQRLEEL